MLTSYTFVELSRLVEWVGLRTVLFIWCLATYTGIHYVITNIMAGVALWARNAPSSGAPDFTLACLAYDLALPGVRDIVGLLLTSLLILLDLVSPKLTDSTNESVNDFEL